MDIAEASKAQEEGFDLGIAKVEAAQTIELVEREGDLQVRRLVEVVRCPGDVAGKTRNRESHRVGAFAQHDGRTVGILA